MRNEHPHVSTAVTQDGAVILNTKEGQISTLNDTGAYVWQALERGEDLEAITVGLARETGEQMETVKSDVLNFIDALKAHKLLSL